MADFLTRLAKRALGEPPVVRPLIAPRFAPAAHPPEQIGGMPVLAESPNEISAPGSRSARRSANLATRAYETETGPEDRSAIIASGEESSSEVLELRPDPAHRNADADPSIAASSPDVPEVESKPGPSSRPMAADPAPTPENRQIPKPDVPERGNAFDTQPEPRPPAEPTPGDIEDPAFSAWRPAALHAPTGVASSEEGVSGRTILRPTEDLAEREVGPGRAPEPLARMQTGGPEAGTASVVPSPPDPGRDVLRIGPAEVGVRSERGLLERHPVSREEPPTIRVNIGRIEVRAMTPPPRQDLSPAKLSLDDYLRQRNGGRL